MLRSNSVWSPLNAITVKDRGCPVGGSHSGTCFRTGTGHLNPIIYRTFVLLSFRLQGGRACTYLCTCREDSHDCPAGSPRGRSYCMVAQDISYSDRCHSHAYSSWVIKILPEVRKSRSLKWCPCAQTKGQWRHYLRRMTGHLHSELLGEV